MRTCRAIQINKWTESRALHCAHRMKNRNDQFIFLISYEFLIIGRYLYSYRGHCSSWIIKIHMGLKNIYKEVLNSFAFELVSKKI